MFEIRGDRAPQGRQKLARERAAYFDLVAQGYSCKQACRIVGVNPRTGKRWRNGTTATGNGPQRRDWQPRLTERPEPCSRYLSQQERIWIADRYRENAGIRVIADELGRDPSTISREVRRNRHPSNGQYRPYAAHDRAVARRARPKTRKIVGDDQLRWLIQQQLDRRLSPEQIAARLRRDVPHDRDKHVCHETIYQAVYDHVHSGLRRGLVKALRTGRAVRKPRRQAQRRQPRYHHPMTLISQRPAEVEDRTVPGHWQGDLIIGKDGASAIGTLVERATRFVKLIHLPHGRSATVFRDALIDAVADLLAHVCRSVTWDQGAEMGRHHEFHAATGIPIYFCDPASPWQRGSNENTNGLLRQYFPKGSDLSGHDRRSLDAVAVELNARPRKTLGWDSPAERFTALHASHHGGSRAV